MASSAPDHGPPIDLRSDTVTRPTPAMRAAIAAAEVGDDVYGDDPTVKQLEARVAELLGTEAALFTPTGTMANQVAIAAHTRPGDEVIIGRNAHIWRHEAGAMAALSGVQTQQMADATFTADEVRAAFRDASDPHSAPTTLVAVENTHNMSGGQCWDRRQLAEVIDSAHALGMAAHLDGARLWNAAVAGGTSERELARGFDSISVCLSKGLGAPAGSVICGRRDFIARCLRLRKRFGGGLRQVGLLAAAGLHALDHHRARLADDHANARALAEALVGKPNIRIDLARVQTNIVMIELDHGSPAAIVERARARGVLIALSGAHRIRVVTHLDVDRAKVMRAAQLIGELAAAS
jgi:threonine aldolase